MNARITKLLLLALLLVLSVNVIAQYGYATVQGSFCSTQTGQGAPGLTVSLVHPSLGRSVPVFTDGWGNFIMGNIPIDPVPYYIEVYWGQRLIYRTQILINGPIFIPRTCL